MPVIEIRNLTKSYAGRPVVDDLSLSIEPGEIFGIVGRNGAGKTTTVETIAGLRTADAGSVTVLGLDPRRDRDELRERLGIQPQDSELPAQLRVAEAIELYASFYRRPADTERLIRDLGLSDKRDSAFGKLSGGQKQRVSVALALVGSPEVAILDELTTGLDPQARRDTWALVRAIRDTGVTVVLVSHFMEEAERLCDRVAILRAGRIAALDTPAALIADAGRRLDLPRPSLEDAFLLHTGEAGITATDKENDR
jgi:ABC-2 type transport system ATP-binding protein